MSADFLGALRRATAPMARQLRQAVSRGIINLINDGQALQEVQVGLLAMPQPDGTMGREISPNVEVIRQYGFTAHPHPGAECVFLSVGGVRTHGLVIAIEDRRYRLQGLAEGEVALYDDLGQVVHLTRTGIVIKGAGLPMLITDIPSLTVEASQMVEFKTPLVKVTGGAIRATSDITDTCDDTGRSMADMRQIYDEHNHPVPAVQPGLATVTTSIPNQQE